eukprot:scaffold470_cov225-Prasinococcus_capsulatus_cf.AAC.4
MRHLSSCIHQRVMGSTSSSVTLRLGTSLQICVRRAARGVSAGPATSERASERTRAHDGLTSANSASFSSVPNSRRQASLSCAADGDSTSNKNNNNNNNNNNGISASADTRGRPSVASGGRTACRRTIHSYSAAAVAALSFWAAASCSLPAGRRCTRLSFASSCRSSVRFAAAARAFTASSVPPVRSPIRGAASVACGREQDWCVTGRGEQLDVATCRIQLGQRRARACNRHRGERGGARPILGAWARKMTRSPVAAASQSTAGRSDASPRRIAGLLVPGGGPCAPSSLRRATPALGRRMRRRCFVCRPPSPPRRAAPRPPRSDSGGVRSSRYGAEPPATS